VAAEIEWAKARMILPSQYPAAANADGRTPPLDGSEIGEIFRRYESEKRRRRLVDFDDLLRLCCRDLHVDREFAAVQHWRHRHLFVDEFQDINPLQFALLQAWSGKRIDLCVVGDPKQAIYGWNGADAHFLADFAAFFPGAERVVLDANHRSTPQVLAAAAAVLHGSTAGPVPRSTRSNGELPSVRCHPTDTDEARGVARAVRDLHRPGTRWATQGVLVRTHAQIALLEEALTRAGVPYRVRGGRSLSEEPEVRSVIRRLRRSGTPFDTALADLETELADLDRDAEASTERRTAIQAVIRAAHDYVGVDRRPTPEGFSAWLRDGAGGDEVDPSRDAVDVCTFHAAKGLEWSTVHLAGLEEGLVPVSHARTPDEREEERRLLYVAITRAERRLVCSWAQERTFDTKAVRRRPSPYLTDMLRVAEAGESGSTERPRDPAELLEAQRAMLRSIPAPPEGPSDHDHPHHGLSAAEHEVLGALHDWRAATARASGVSAFVILSDETLAAVVRRSPHTVDDLLQVPGIGPVKAGRYGDALLRVVRQHQVS
jgi:DNA helicase-2/ATP-dependent DNA helicase PcrA